MVAEYDEAEAVESVRDDWQHDSGGADCLTREMFMDCVFELADVWTVGTDPADYTACFSTNALGALMCTQAVLPKMLESEGAVLDAHSKGVAKKGTLLYTSASAAVRSTATSAPSSCRTTSPCRRTSSGAQGGRSAPLPGAGQQWCRRS